MNNFHSHRLIKQLEDSSKSPVERLINLFDIMEKLPSSTLPAEARKELIQYLTAIARSSNIHHPEIFAQQLFFMASEAREKQLNQPESLALKHAQIAAKALVNAQTKNRFARNSHLYAMAASFFLIFGVSSMMLSNHYPVSPEELQIAGMAETMPDTHLELVSNPKHISEMLSQRDKIREGRCQFPEAIVFSEAERGIYLQNVVHGEISANKEVQDVSSRLREFVRCDYTPMLMKNSIS